MIDQVGALPYRLTDTGEVADILLITSRATGRWVVPKGNLMLGKARHEAAAIEAGEEAGVCGIISPLSLGRFDYIKRRAGFADQQMRVELFAFEVREELSEWKEKGQRDRRWFALAEAAIAVDEADLGELIHRFGQGHGPRPSA